MRIKAYRASPVARLADDRPVVAILTVDDEIQSFRGNRANFADLIQTGRELGVTTYVVTINDLKLKSPEVVGYTYRPEEEAWVQEKFPRPNIVYNRIPLREDERQPNVKRKLALISRQPGIKMFNRRFFNKWLLFRWLYNNPSTRRFIPDTKKLTDVFVLAGLLKRHRLLYLKPVRGKAGVGIMTVKVQPEKHLPYRLQIQEERGSRTYRCSTMRSLWHRVSEYSETIGEPYIAQQGIALVSVDDRPFDLRALAQKNQAGKWELTGIGARVAGNTSITTHVPRGGNIDDPEKLLTGIFGAEKAQQVLANVKRAILLIARQIERASRSRLGEMSMDLGVDTNGNVWFLEANSKPMKFDETDIRQKSLQRIFHYSFFLHRGTKQTGRR
ncbi:YheC/YheD family protein [Cohnella sp. CFH 77786]|uniref:YheC/YheD family endospore coat-associated protein n=1 Tax=Cohnella sp. CFH 77786 TaxID=2662265 RepID=UPI001C60E411|nr:YheC/YheD family protein [Cohnella sp. CFH 77786]MBW5447805.1 YheC/YheD family protein [Cohnella sp. CFH 77786]